MPTALKTNLSGLSVREAIQDTLYRCVTGLDIPDRDLFLSAFTADAVFDLDGRVLDGIEAIEAGCFDPISKLDTTHFITNMRIEHNDLAASVTASALAQHFREGQGLSNEPRLLAGALYDLELVKEGELWKIKLWKMHIVWGEGDFKIVMPA